ncbi:hypothetical protein B0H17DRAFT_1144816 [Mycena rosella]|uniref:Uncharacterized protein n=1 Tax=Mycena rosella TaxID=1033263 RepID=A0AAD7G695_MYCRO|nr:hypothetical protein B0H17DRAFT_1144816 [Mycena rosella]
MAQARITRDPPALQTRLFHSGVQARVERALLLQLLETLSRIAASPKIEPVKKRFQRNEIREIKSNELSCSTFSKPFNGLQINPWAGLNLALLRDYLWFLVFLHSADFADSRMAQARGSFWSIHLNPAKLWSAVKAVSHSPYILHESEVDSQVRSIERRSVQHVLRRGSWMRTGPSGGRVRWTAKCSGFCVQVHKRDVGKVSIRTGSAKSRFWYNSGK